LRVLAHRRLTPRRALLTICSIAAHGVRRRVCE
jgi:hypothetical protein